MSADLEKRLREWVRSAPKGSTEISFHQRDVLEAAGTLAAAREWAESGVPEVIPYRHHDANGYKVAQEAVLAILRQARRRMSDPETWVRGVTRRRHPSGKVHEMADMGVATLCGMALPEPWDWVAVPVSCKRCLIILNKSDIDE